jgi:hypothetical protein
MNYLKSGAICVLLSFCLLNVQAQSTASPTEPDYNKPKLFADLADRHTINVADLELLFALPVGQTINASLSASFPFRGTIVSKSDPADANLKSVIIKSTNRLGATFGFTRLQKEDGSFIYRGRMISNAHSDAFDIEWEAGQYVLVKKHTLKLINE